MAKANLDSSFVSIERDCACVFRSLRRSLWDHSQQKQNENRMRKHLILACIRRLPVLARSVLLTKTGNIDYGT
jgi:hypothetical protein